MSFTINYKGTNCRGIAFDYLCPDCGAMHQVTHTAEEEPKVECLMAKCSGQCHKKPTAPAFDADHHDSMKSHNIGWDENA